MHAVALICQADNGHLLSQAYPALQPALDDAFQCRRTGSFQGKAIKQGLVLSASRPLPVYEFRYRPDLEPPAKAEDDDEAPRGRVRRR